MDTGARGRKTHIFYSKLYFINTKLENGRTAAQCTVCNVVLKNTAVARLRTHRKRCHPADSSGSEDEQEESVFGYTTNLTKHVKRSHPLVNIALEDSMATEKHEINSEVDGDGEEIANATFAGEGVETFRIQIEPQEEDSLPRKRKPKAKITNNFQLQSSSSSKVVPTNEDEVFGNLVACELAQITDSVKKRAIKKKIMQALYEIIE